MITIQEAKNVRLRCPDDKARWDIFVDNLFEELSLDKDKDKICKNCIYYDAQFKVCDNEKFNYDDSLFYVGTSWSCGEFIVKAERNIDE